MAEHHSYDGMRLADMDYMPAAAPGDQRNGRPIRHYRYDPDGQRREQEAAERLALIRAEALRRYEATNG